MIIVKKPKVINISDASASLLMHEKYIAEKIAYVNREIDRELHPRYPKRKK